MIFFNRKTEYALLAIEYMIRKTETGSDLTNTREVSEAYHIPYPVLGKVMQQLAGKGLIKSVQGVHGGYVLVKKPVDISVKDVLEIFDGSFALAECFGNEKITCPQWGGCKIKHPLYELNHKIYRLLSDTSVADIASRHNVSSGGML